LTSTGKLCRGKNGQYTVTSHISTGGMGSVFEAKDQNNRDVVIKFPATKMPDGHLMSPHYHSQVVDKLKVEAEVLKNFQNLKSKYVVQYIDESYDSNDYFFVMEKLFGSTIEDKVSNTPLPESKVIQFSLDILEGLEFLHKHNTIYRDMKPGNVIATKNGRCVLIDFGTAKQGMTQHNSNIAGGNATGFQSAGWTCPEQQSGRASAECDLYAVGRVMFFMATGIKPGRLETHTGKMTKKIHEVKPSISIQLSELVNEMIDPEHNTIHTANGLKMKLKTISISKSGNIAPVRISSSSALSEARIVLQGSEYRISNNPSGSLIGKNHNPVTCSQNNDGCNSNHEGNNIFVGWNCPSGCRCSLNPAHKIDKHHMRIWKNSLGQVCVINNDQNRRSAINRLGKWMPMIHLKKEILKNHDQVALLYNEKKGPYLSFTFYTK
jgi:serine/threonine protein kinase